MKNIILYTAAAFSLSLASCSESFLDMESATETNTDTYYKTETDVDRALIGCYAGLRETQSDGGMSLYMGSMMQSDECFAGAGMNDATNYNVVDEFDLSQAPSYVNLWETDWKAYYTCIDRCNELITREGQISWSGNRGLKIGQARGLRAVCYFDLVRMFENIPLLKEPSSANVPQADPDDVYALIFEDLKYAADSIPAKAFPKSEASSNDGRFTKYAAEGLMARAYLYYTGRFGKEPAGCTKAQALAACEDIIASGEYSLVPQFKNLWPASSCGSFKRSQVSSYEDWLSISTYAGTGNCEEVFAIKCNNTQDYNGNNDGNRWVVNVGLRGIQAINCSPYGYGWGICTVNPALAMAYGTGDQRKEASIINVTSEGIDKKTTSDGSTSFADKLTDQREYTGYYVKKYTPMADDGTDDVESGNPASLPLIWGGAGDAMTAQWQDVIVLRYADVLLMAAELGSSKAQTYFDQVRKRAYTTDENGTLDSNYKQVLVSQQNIMDERRLEFAFEGLRYYDLLRQGLDVAANTIAGTTDVKNGGVNGTVTIKAENIKAKKGLCQIPNNQITLSSGVLKQNDGWK